ncbi:MAG: hypothetical protein PWP65_1014 [Clostridia bacterium]|nr:hypothetical protein [Clostridia bacterium]
MNKARYIFLGFLLGAIVMAGINHGLAARKVEPVQAQALQVPPTPFDVIYSFYKAVEQNDPEKVKEITTPALWEFLKRDRFLERWQRRKRVDPGLRFVLFLVSEQNLDEAAGTAWARGQAQWQSPRRGVISATHTIFLQRLGGKWKIKEIQHNTPIEAADDFYQAIEDADWKRLQSLTLEAYWRRLEAGGVIRALQKERQESKSGVYVVFYIYDFAQSGNRAWVKGDVLWRPLSAAEKETPVIVELQKEKDKWLVAKISGHWEAAK